MLGDQADVGLGEAHVEVEGGGQRRAQAVAKLVQEDETEDQRGAAPALAAHEFVEGFGDRLAQGFRHSFDGRFADQPGHGHAGQHEGAGNPEHLVPRQAVGQDQRQRAGNQTGNAVGVHMHGIAEAEFMVAQDFAAEGIDSDVLRCREQREERRQPQDGPDVVLWTEAAEEADGEQQADLGHQHPASATTEAGQAEAVEQRRPEEFPGIGKLDQGEEADGLQVDALAAQPGRQQVEQQVERQARGEAGKDADQHLPVEQRSEPGRHQRLRVRR